jgi:Spy/CpxP family protein refolding chaperone
MPRIRGLAWALVAVLSLPCTAVAEETTDTVSAASPYAFADGQHAEEMARWRDALNLSPEQQAIMAEIVMDYGARLRPLFERGADTAWSIMNVAPKDPDYSIDTERAAQAAAETAAEIVRVISEFRSAMHSVMTAEQIATLDALLEEWRQRWREKSTGVAAPAE